MNIAEHLEAFFVALIITLALYSGLNGIADLNDGRVEQVVSQLAR